jgi:flagellar FliL protein
MSETSVEDEEEKSGGGLLKIILIVLVVLLLMVGTAVGTMFATGFFDEKPESEDPEAALLAAEAEMEETEEQLASAQQGPKTAEIDQKFVISYYKFEDAFQVNLKGSKKMMQAKLGVSTHFDNDIMFAEGDGAPGWIPKHLIGIRAAILKLLRNVAAVKFETQEGETEVLEEIRMVINEQLEKHEKTTSAPIEEVYFTELIVQ